jgi:hypothetical protein
MWFQDDAMTTILDASFGHRPPGTPGPQRVAKNGKLAPTCKLHEISKFRVEVDATQQGLSYAAAPREGTAWI